MMYAVISKTTTILVDYDKVGNNFIIEDLLTRRKVTIPHRELEGDLYKYPCDFKEKFFKRFAGKTEWIFTAEGIDAYITFMNANREGIFTPYQ